MQILELNGNYQIQFLKTQKGNESKKVFLLLHGYLQDAHFMHHRFEKDLPSNSSFYSINAPFPVLKKFPLSSENNEDKLIAGYAWYFFDPRTSEYLVPMDFSLSLLKDFIQKEILKYTSSITVIGYSQGGYLLGELSNMVKEIELSIAINSSPKFPLSEPSRLSKIIYLNGKEDSIVDPLLAQERFTSLTLHPDSQFQLIEAANHKLSKELIFAAKQFF